MPESLPPRADNVHDDLPLTVSARSRRHARAVRVTVGLASPGQSWAIGCLVRTTTTAAWAAVGGGTKILMTATTGDPAPTGRR